LVLYDIDGTLLNTQGAGREALNRAFVALHGVERAFDAVNFGGATDQSIVQDAFEHAGLSCGAPERAALKRRYLRELERGLAAEPERVQWCPGAAQTVLATSERAQNALLTGNWRQGAELKLGTFFQQFAFGAFGDDSPRRNDLVPVARERARAAGIEPDRVVVIGDTPADVACARAGGAVAVAVCTGWSSRTTLEVTGPDLLLDDLHAGREALLALL